MDPERWARIKSVFHAAVELPDAERAEYIRSRCEGDNELAAQIEGLLAANDQNQTFIESPALESIGPAVEDDNDPDAGKRIGPYRVVRRIGIGGMGSVYLAERADQQFDKRVAIKIIRQGLGEEIVIQRFVAERQMLARLEHPNIARLLDGGTTEEGLPYLVMEYVEGKPITEYCEGKALSTTERLVLFRMVCGAVHHAHQNLIVHRDIKPGNILVTEEGQPKLLDFGIAKLLSPDEEPGKNTTLFGRLMTPDYASPEQAKGEPITTASDVYSLGVLLYELLTGLRPYRITSSSPLEIVQVICEREPVRPSTAVEGVRSTIGGSNAGSDPGAGPPAVGQEGVQLAKLRRQLRGDLDNIVLKAMSKEPGRRYSSAQEFSEDIRRHLEGQPVNARPSSLNYRAGKFARRHKTGVVSAAIILVLLAAGVAGIAREAVIARRQRARAEKRFNDVRRFANESVFKFHDSIADLPGSTEARKLIVTEALQYLNSLVNDASDDPSLQSELAAAYYKLGDIQGASRAGNLGDFKGALESHRKALALRQTLAAAKPGDPDLQLWLASSYQQVGLMLARTGDPEAGIANIKNSIEICEAVLAAGTNPSQARHTLAYAQHSLGMLLSRRDPAAALDYCKKAIGAHEEILAENPGDFPIRRNLSLLYKNAGALMHSGNDRDGALVLYNKALSIDEADFAANPNDTEVRLALSFSYGSIGSALADKGDLKRGLAYYRKALDLRLSVANSDSKNAFARNAVASAYDRIGSILLRIGDTNGAFESYEKMLEIAGSNTAIPLEAAVRARMGDSFFGVASDPGRSEPSKLKYLREAVRWYHSSLNSAARAEVPFSDARAKETDRIAGQLSRCEVVLHNEKKKTSRH